MVLFRRALPAAASSALASDAPPALPVAPPGLAEAADIAEALSRTCALIEADIERATGDVALHNTQAVEWARTMARDAGSIVGEMRLLSHAAGTANEAVGAIANATAEVSAAGREIAARASESSAKAQGAVAEAEEAAEAVRALSAATDGISGVVRLIKDIAERINLLALNATIEAARAGEAGRGFAVVAGEVKALAHRTKAMTGEIAGQIEGMRASARGTAEAVERIGGTVAVMNAINASVAAAVEEQDATLRQISAQLADVSGETATLSRTVAHVEETAAAIGATSGITTSVMTETAQMIDELGGRLVVSLRSASVNNRRNYTRVPVELAGQLRLDGTLRHVTVLDLSEGGALLRLSEEDAQSLGPRGPATLELAETGALDVMRVGGRARRRHVQFMAMDEAKAERLRAFLERVQADDRRFVAAAQEGARDIGAALERAVESGRIRADALFDFTYTRIPGSDPPQFTSPFTELTDALFPAVQERLLTLDPRVAFAASVDANGYLPTHNAKYSAPQRPGERSWNMAHCRNRRIFNDRAGLSAGRCSGDFQLQSYERDMGGEIVLMKEADAPITVQGRQWGGFRLAYRAA